MSARVYPEGKLRSNRAKRIRYFEHGECWICVSHPLAHGIPHIKRGSLRSRPVAEYVYEREVGPTPNGMLLTRSCGQLRCIQPAHVAWKPFTDTRKARGAARERVGRLSDMVGVEEAARRSGLSTTTVVRIRKEFGYSNRHKRDPDTGRYIHRPKRKSLATDVDWS